VGKDAIVPSDADVEMLCSYFDSEDGVSFAASPRTRRIALRIQVRQSLENDPAFVGPPWDRVRAGWALLCAERTRMVKALRQEAACQNGKDRDDAPYAAAVLAMVADELEATTMLASPPEPPKVTPLPATPAAPDKAHDEAPPTIETVVTVLAREALRAGTMHPNDTKRLLAWLSTSHNPNAR